MNERFVMVVCLLFFLPPCELLKPDLNGSDVRARGAIGAPQQVSVCV